MDITLSMRFSVNILVAICLGFLGLKAKATTYYVDINSTDPTPPYTSWATAAINIQDAVNMANAGDTVLVTNGAPPAQPNGIAIYQFSGATAGSYSNRVAVLQPITLQSVNGPALTWIEGSFDSARCVFLTNGAVLSGFTLTNGFAIGSGAAAEGGGVCAQSTNATITNCIIMDCSADYGAAAYSGTLYNCLIESNYYAPSIGVGAYTSVLNNCFIINNTTAGSGGGAAYSTLNNCVLSNNLAEYGGATYDCVLSNCTLVKNSSAYGGACFGGVLNNCILTNNSAILYGGAAAGGDFSGNGNYSIVLNDCLVGSNTASEGGGVAGGYDSNPTNCLLNNCTLMFNAAGSGGAAYYAELNNCLIISNNALSGASEGGGAVESIFYNCTIAANSAHSGGGTFICAAFNSIVYNNSGISFSNYYVSTDLNYCCTLPAAGGVGNITNNPDFVNPAAGNFQLQANSPCINAGNNAYVASATDLAGSPRIAGGTVDIGAYEYQSPTSVISYAYLQQYGLPTDGSVDFADLDGTAFNVYQDWVAGLNPTNPASVLAMISPAPTNNVSGITVSWESVSGINYTLQRSTSLPVFTNLRINLAGQAGTTSYTDTTATNNWPYFYRVGVQVP